VDGFKKHRFIFTASMRRPKEKQDGKIELHKKILVVNIHHSSSTFLAGRNVYYIEYLLASTDLKSS